MTTRAIEVSNISRGEDEFARSPTAASIQGCRLTESDDIFNLGRIHRFAKNEGAKLLFCHRHQPKAAAFSLSQIKARHLGHHVLHFWLRIFWNHSPVDTDHLGAG